MATKYVEKGIFCCLQFLLKTFS